MAKFHGIIGYVETTETRPGVWHETLIAEHDYCGDVIKDNRRFQSSGQANDDINVTNRISIVADQFANSNFKFMRYVVYMGVKWKITDIDVQRPRLILTLGGVYNGK